MMRLRYDLAPLTASAGARLLLWTFVTVFTLAYSPGLGAQQLYALVIGIDKYVLDAPANNLEGAVADAKDIAQSAPLAVMETRATVRTGLADRVKAATIAKNRLQSVLHRHQFDKPEASDPYTHTTRDFWLSLPVSGAEQLAIEMDLETIALCEAQQERIEALIHQEAVKDERLPFLLQLPGVGLVSALTILAVSLRWVTPSSPSTVFAELMSACSTKRGPPWSNATVRWECCSDPPCCPGASRRRPPRSVGAVLWS